jgi:PEP-CTERM/exosortase A-associated glycosyltransferase
LPLHSGYSFRSQSIFESLKSAGYQPIVLTSPKHEQSYRAATEKEEIIEGQKYYRSGRIAVNRVEFVSEIMLIHKLFNRIIEIVEIEKPEIIHVHSPVLNLIPALLVKRKLKIPVVYEIRAFWEDAGVDHGTYKEDSIRYKIVRNLETFGCKHASHVIAICNGIKKDLSKRGINNERISQVSNGIDPEKFKLSLGDIGYLSEWRLNEKIVIGFIGSFYRYEGLDLLIKAFSKIAKKERNVVLLLVGGGEMEQSLKQQILELKLETQIIMPGRIPHDGIPGVYALIDIMAYPRYAMRLTNTVTPLKPLEAMAMGKAVVASDVGGHKELIQDEITGILHESGSSTKLAECLYRLIKDVEMRKILGKNARRWVLKNRTWERCTQLYDKIYQKLLKYGS